MSKKEKLFIIFENRYHDLHQLINNKNFSKKTMGEITWFLSLMKTLEMRGYKVIHCKNESIFLTNYANNINNSDVCFLMDYITIPKLIHCLQGVISKIYCMHYWKMNCDKLKKLGKTPDNQYIRLKNVLTPFDYYDNSTYLGYNLDVSCRKIFFRKYKKYGVLWGKEAKLIDPNLVGYLCGRGVKFYATSQTPITIDGVTNLGVLPKGKWHQLLSDCKFVLGSGHPRSGPTIVEALYYKTALIGPRAQFPQDTHNANTHFIDDLSNDEIFNIIQNVKFEPDAKVDELCSSDNFNKRIDAIFDL